MTSSPQGAKLKGEPHKMQGTGCDIYGDRRLKLALLVRDWLSAQEELAVKGELNADLPVQNFNWFIESGTLLGAYRNNKFIPHDDDFDMAILLHTTMDQAMANDRALVRKQLNVWADLLKQDLPAPYTARVISTYCDKIEVYDPTQGKYVLPGAKYNGAEYHHVTVDLQVYTIIGPESAAKETLEPGRNSTTETPQPQTEPSVIQSGDGNDADDAFDFPSKPHAPAAVQGSDIFESMYRVAGAKGPLQLKYGDMVPCGKITLEGEEFQCPRVPLAFLTAEYGSIKPGAVYDAATGKYVDPPQDP